MASSTPTMPVNAAVAVTTPKDAFRQLWTEALLKCEQSMSNDASQWQSLLQRMDGCHKAEDVCVILDEAMLGFERFRGSNTTWGKLRNKYLKPAIEVLLLFNDAIAETAASFPNVPGGKAMFVAFGVLLQATKGVSAYCEALVVLFEELNMFLESLRPRLHTPASLGPASKTIAITILAHLLDVVTHATRILSKRPWLGRLALYGRALVKDATMQGALQRLRALTLLEARAMTGEIRVDAAETRDLTNQLLSELQKLNQGHVQATVTRGLIERGMEKLLQSQKDVMAFLRIEREHRESIDASRLYEKLERVSRADIDAQSPEGCMKGTRITVLRDLRSWSHDRNAPRIYWLNGMAGTGKSAIARSFCHVMRRDKLLGGSFFCSRGGSVEEGDAQRIIPTLAASMASRSLTFNKSVLAELKEESSSPHWNLALQIERLLQKPLSTFDEGSPMLVLVIDALDECSDEDVTRDLLSRLVRISAALPVKFFLTSRPEPHIRQQLEALDPSLSQILRLHDIEQDIVKADISLYLARGLRSMREPNFPPKWPHKADIATLTRLSGKLFIYAFTALQYLRKDPMGRLPKLTGTVVTAGRPLTQPLDAIYSLILSEAMDPDEYEPDEINLTRQTIATIVTVREPMTVESLGSLLGLPAIRLRASLNRLYAVIYVPIRDTSGVLSTFHASFGDFLNTPTRTPDGMHEHISNSHSRLATACLETLESDRLHFNVSQATSSYYPNEKQKLANIDSALRYACLYWSHHVAAASGTLRFDPTSVLCRILAGPKFLFWLEALSAIGLAEKALDMLEDLRYVPSTPSHEWPQLLAALIDFIYRFSPAFVKSAPHVYLSAFYLCDKESIIRQKCSSSFLGIPAFISDIPSAFGQLPTCAAYTQDGTCIVVGNSLEFHYYSKLDLQRPRPSRLGVVEASGFGAIIAISKEGTRAACASDGDRAVFLQLDEIETYSNRLSVIGSSERGDFSCIAYSEQDDKIAGVLDRNKVCLWDAGTSYLAWKCDIPGKSGAKEVIHVVTFSPNGSILASGHSSGEVFLWNVMSGTLVHPVPHKVHKSYVSAIDFRPYSGTAASGSGDGTICLWRVSDGEILTRLETHAATISSVAFSPDATRLVSGSAGGIIHIWQTTIYGIEEQPIRQIDVLQPVRAVTFSPDQHGQNILCVTEYGAVQLWNTNQTHSACVEDIWGSLRLDDDGWLRCWNGELLLWIPKDSEYRKMLTHPHCSSVIYGGRSDQAWTNLPQGNHWPLCYTGHN
ncbi:hypothetical protein PENSPDRAFT_747783 [Peniophora sp. CONT]|nr:hypothetical protein PENSPDRAFT_747783 [Peniophora sp. CONT]